MTLNQGQQCLNDVFAVAMDGHVRCHAALAELLLLDIHMNYPALPPLCRSLRLWCVFVEYAGGSVVESAAHSDDEVCLLYGQVAVGRPVHPQHVEAQRVLLVKHTHSVDRRRHRYRRLGSELPHLVGRTDGPLTHIQDGPLGLVNEVRQLLYLLHVHQRLPPLEGLHLDLLGQLALEERLGQPYLSGRDVLGQVDMHRAGAAAGGDAEGLLHRPWQVLDLLSSEVPFGAGFGQRTGRALLEGVAAYRTSRHLAREHDEWDSIADCVLQGGDEVGQTWPRRHHSHTDLAG
mmetsp:Transcript_35994/g.89746  ORF Transcript_35994/g.89746 Transcript_35994/m.89746 type:complete len:289 (+) Transcript_35994:1549-2415(+)